MSRRKRLASSKTQPFLKIVFYNTSPLCVILLVASRVETSCSSSSMLADKGSVREERKKEKKKGYWTRALRNRGEYKMCQATWHFYLLQLVENSFVWGASIRNPHRIIASSFVFENCSNLRNSIKFNFQVLTLRNQTLNLHASLI